MHEQQGVPADPRSLDDVGELYRLFSGRLVRIVRGGVHAPRPVIEDACQVAWSRLLRHPDRVRRDTVLSWLTATAMHEALKLVERSGREPSLEAMIERGGDISAGRIGCGPDSMAEARERLGSLTALPARQQQALWLYGLGLSYAEIAHRQGSTARAVERQLQRARTKLRRQEGTLELGW